MDGVFSQPKGDNWYWNSTEDYSFGVQVWLGAHLRQTFPAPVWDSKDSAKVNQDKKKWKIPYSHFTEKLEPEINVSGPACLVFPDRTPWLSSLPWKELQQEQCKPAVKTLMWLSLLEKHHTPLDAFRTQIHWEIWLFFQAGHGDYFSRESTCIIAGEIYTFNFL